MEYRRIKGGLVIRINAKGESLYNIGRITFTGSNGGETLNISEINFNEAVTDTIEIKLSIEDLTPTEWNYAGPVVLTLNIYEYNDTDDTSVSIRYYPGDNDENRDEIDISQGWYYINRINKVL